MERGVDVLDMAVGELLQLVALGVVFVLADLVILFQPLENFHPSRRTLRTATRAASAYFEASLESSLRRSWLSSGNGMRKSWPSICGLRPRPASRIALSTALASPLSHTCTVIMRASGVAMLPTWLIGTELP